MQRCFHTSYTGLLIHNPACSQAYWAAASTSTCTVRLQALTKVAAAAVDHSFVLAHAARAAIAARAHVAAVESDDSGVDANARGEVGTVTQMLRMQKAVKRRGKRSASKEGTGHALVQPAVVAAPTEGADLQMENGEGHEGTGEEEKKARKRAKRLKQRQKRAQLGAEQGWKAKVKARKERKKERVRKKREDECVGLC